jgi:hypothetical protein
MADSLLREVDDDVRAERIAKLWMRYRTHLLVLVMAIVLASIGDAAWEHHQQTRGGELLLQLSHAQGLLESGKSAQAVKAFADIAAHTDGDIHTIARLWQARAAGANGAKDEAIDILKQTTQATSGLWGDIACLRLAGLDAKEATCLTAKKDSPLAAQRAQWAAANAWAAGDAAQATTLLTQLVADKNTPPSIRDEAQSWLGAMAQEKDSK